MLTALLRFDWIVIIVDFMFSAITNNQKTITK